MEVHSALSEELAEGQSSKGCSEWQDLDGIFINDLGAGVECTVGQLANDPELGGAAYPLKACEALQTELNKWSLLSSSQLLC